VGVVARKALQSKPEHAASQPDPQLDPGQHRRRRRPIWTVVTALVVLVVAGSIAMGVWGGGRGLKGLRAQLGIGDGRTFVALVESREGLVVMMVGREGFEEVRALEVPSWDVRDVSRGARPARGPVLSPSGERIVFFATRREDTEVKVSEVGGGARTLVSASELAWVGDRADLAEFHVCPWSGLAWSRDDRYVAFYGCSETESIIVVKDRTTRDLVVLASTKVSVEEPRTLAWVSDRELVFVRPEDGSDTVWKIDVISLDRRKVYGP
jgi:hypothetical protein